MLGVGTAGPVGVDTATTRALLPAVGAPEARGPIGAERDAWAVLAGVFGLGPVGFGILLERYGSGVAILDEASSPGGPDRMVEAAAADVGRPGRRTRDALAPELATAIARAADEAPITLARIRELGLAVVTVEDPAYPARLGAVEMPPHLLYVLGDPTAMSADAAIAIVGTRRATNAGRATAARIAASLVEVGASVVSGLAVGIDGAAHSAAIHANGTTVAVIGSGHAVLHPRAHARLADAIVAAGGAVVSELSPDTRPSVGTFPRRNRVISGLADATVVVEAPARSGALITASWALDQGRDCYLVPGPIDEPASAGCLAFLREFPGSTRIVAGIPQLIADLGLADRLAEPRARPEVAATLAEFGAVARRLGREIVDGRATVDELVAVSGWPVATVLAALTMLEARGLIVGVHGRYRPAAGLAAADTKGRRQRPRTRA
ncbi:MAG: DNA-processing protein DprA [Chloroflexota bacterium]